MNSSVNRYLRQFRFALGLFSLSFLIASSAHAQIIVPKHGHDSIRVCGGTLKDRDSLQQAYEGGRDGILTLYPLAHGTRVKLTFSIIDLGDDDYIEIYNGSSINSPLLGRFYGLYTKIFESTDTSGALTVLFKTEYDTYAWGFSAFIECLVPTVEKDIYSKLISTYSNPSFVQNRLEYNSFLRGNGTQAQLINKAYLSKDEFWDQNDSLFDPGFQYTQAPNSTGQFATYNYILTSEPGEHFTLVKADANNILAEPDEANNLLAIPFDVDSFYVDLVPAKVYNNANEVYQNRLEIISSSVCNLGTLKSSQFNCHLYFSLDSLLDPSDSLLGNKSFNEMYPNVYGSSVQFGFQLDTLIPIGEYYLILMVDPDSLVNERVEANNLLVYPIRLLRNKIDISLRDVGILQSDIAPNGFVNTFQTIIISGYTPTYPALACYLSLDSIFDQSDVSLSPANYPYFINGNYKGYSIPPTVIPGNYFLVIVVDPGNVIVETNENNNSIILPLRVVMPRADLKFEERFWNNPYNWNGIQNHFSIGQGFITKMNAYNNGNQISPNCDIGYYLSKDDRLDSTDKIIITKALGVLYPEQKSSPEIGLGWLIPSWLTNGKYYIITKIDMYDIYPEVDELNNLMIDSIYIDANQYDLYTENRSMQKDIYKSTDTISFVTPVNGNYLPVNGIQSILSLTKTYVTTKKEIDSTAIAIQTTSAPPPSSLYMSAVLPVNLQNGIYYLTTQIDELDSLHERNESNNTNFNPFSITNGIINFDSIRSNKHDTILTCYSNIKCNQLPNGELTLMPGVPGKKLAMYLSEVYSQGSRIEVYDGMDSTANLIYTLDQAQKPTSTIYSTNTAGALTLKSKINNQNWITSSFHATAACLDSVPLPDLCFSNYGNYASNTLVSNNFEKIKLTFIAGNMGGEKVNSSALCVYFSTDEILDSLDTPLDTVELINLYGGIEKKIESTFNLPGNLLSNEYFLIAKIDNMNSCIEQSEINNTYITRLLIQNALPEFSLRKTNFDTYSLTQNPYSIHGSTSLYNSAGIYTDSIAVALYLSNDSLFDANDTLLQLAKRVDFSMDFKKYNPAIKYDIELPLSINVGNYYLLLVVDPENKAIESNESNNIVVCPLNLVARTADISIIDFSISFPYINGKRNIALSPLRYLNFGNYQQDSLFKVATYLSIDSILDSNDVILDSNFIPSLGYSYWAIPNQSYIGNFYIFCYADFNQKLVEVNETNNIFFKKVELKDTLADIDAMQIATTSRMIRAGNLLAINASFNFNSGNLNNNVNYVACLSIDTIFDVSDIRIDSGYTNIYNYGKQILARSYIYLPQTVPSGNYFILVSFDSGNQLPEKNELNNFCWTPLYVLPNRTDICFENAFLSSNQSISNDFVVANTTVYNHSNVFLDSSYVHYYLSNDSLLDGGDLFLTYSYSERILPGSYSYKNTLLSLPNLPVNSDYFVLCKVDGNNYLQEDNELNNLKALPLHISQPFQDLNLQMPDISNHWLVAGDSVELSVQVQNLGNSFCPNTGIPIYLSKDMIIDAQDSLLTSIPINGLAAGAGLSSSSHLKLPAQIDTGNYYFLFWIDYPNLIAETNEQNNAAYLPFNVSMVGMPDQTDLSAHIQLAPNPFHNKLRLSFTDSKPKSFKIYNPMGQAIYEQNEISVQQLELNTQGWKAGSYFIEVKEKESIFRRKLIKTN